MGVVLAKAFLSFACVVAWLVLRRLATLESMSGRDFDRLIISGVAATRLGMFAVAFGIIGLTAVSDVTVYYAEAKMALAGQIPLIDIKTAYGPFNPYVGAGAIFVWDSPKAIVLLSVVIELIGVPFWLSVGRSAFDERTLRNAAVLYVFCPLPLYVAISGQNNVWIATLLAISLWYGIRGRWFASGVAFGATIAVVKFLSLLYWPALFLWARRKFWLTLGVALLPAIGYGILLFRGLHPADQVRYHAAYSSSGNLPYLLTLAGVDYQAPATRFWLNVTGFALLCAFFCVIWWRYGRPMTLPATLIIMPMVMLFTLPIISKSFSAYLNTAAFPLCLAIVYGARSRPAPLALFMLWCAWINVEPSLFFRLMNEHSFLVLHAPVVDVSRAAAWAFVPVELILLAGFGGALWLCWRALCRLIVAREVTVAT